MKDRKPIAQVPAREDTCDISEEAERSHRNFLQDFRENAYPFLAEHGLTFPEALTFWMLARIENQLDEIIHTDDNF